MSKQSRRPDGRFAGGWEMLSAWLPYLLNDRRWQAARVTEETLEIVSDYCLKRASACYELAAKHVTKADNLRWAASLSSQASAWITKREVLIEAIAKMKALGA